MLITNQQAIVSAAYDVYLGDLALLSKRELFGIGPCKTSWAENININMILNALDADSIFHIYTDDQRNCLLAKLQLITPNIQDSQFCDGIGSCAIEVDFIVQ